MNLPSSALLALLLLLFPIGSFAQVILIDDSEQRQSGPIYRGLNTRTEGLDTLPFSTSKPFFDDFSGQADIYPDTSLWFAGAAAFDAPTLTQRMAFNPPTQGVATFDGLQRRGTPYFTTGFSSGTADRLFSHHIDLSSQSPEEGVVLSFFLQQGGRGERPEATDSFFVYVRTNVPGDGEYQKIYAKGGGGNTGVFEEVALELTDSSFFHQGFQLLFESQGGLSGALDMWHLDYVFLAPGRNPGPLTFADASLTQLLSSPLDPYTAIPTQHYPDGGNFMRPFVLNATNLNGSSENALVEATIRESVSQSPFLAGDRTFVSGSLVPYAQQTSGQNMNPFSDQSFAGEIAGYEMEAVISMNADDFAGNDTLHTVIPVDSVLAYDDGEADRGFGLNQRLGFGMRVDLDRPDSLTGIWISFLPAVYVNEISGETTYMEDQTFRVIIWNAPNPDSIFAEQAGGMRVRYGDRPNHFERYPFAAPVAVPATFWIGIQQTSSLPISVGYDLTYNRDDLTFFDASGNWVNATQGGALMIRPEFFRTASLPAADIAEPARPPQQASLFPQPVRAGESLQLRRPLATLSAPYEGVLMDLSGRILARYQLSPHAQASFRLPATLSPGIYLWRHTGKIQGRPWNQIDRVWVQ